MVKLILDSIYRQKLLFILIGIIMAVFSIYLILGLNTAFSVTGSLKAAIRDNLSGDCILTSSEMDYLDYIGKSGEGDLINIKDSSGVVSFLNSLEGVEEAFPRLRISGQGISEKNDMGLVVIGVSSEENLASLPGRFLREGQWLSEENQSLLYYRHADELNVKTGEYLGIRIPTLDGYTASVPTVLTGQLGFKELGFYLDYCNHVFVPVESLSQWIGSPDVLTSEILIMLKSGVSLNTLRKALEDKYPGRYSLWKPQDVSSLFSGIYLLVFFSIFLVAGLMLFFVFLTSSFLVSVTIETRRKEIGIYQAMGVSLYRISLLIGGEVASAALLFGVGGTLISLLLMKSLSYQGIHALIIPLKMIFGRPVLFISNYGMTFLLLFLFLFVGVLLAMFNGLLKLSKLDPIDVLREA